MAPYQVKCPGGGEKTQCRTNTGIGGYDEPGRSQFFCQAIGMDRTGPAKCNDGGDPGVPSFLGNVGLCGPRHGLVNQVMNAPYGLYEWQPQGFCDTFLNPLPGSLFIKRYLSAKKIILIQISQQEVRIGNPGILTPPAVTDGSRLRPGTLGAHLEGPHLAYLGDASAPGPDLHEVHHRHLNGQTAPLHKPLDTAHLKCGDNARHPLLDQAGLCSGSPHVKTEHLRDIKKLPVILPRDDRCRGS